MASVNKIILIGNLGADPETRDLPSGGTICNLRLATTEKWKDKTTGETKEISEWHRVVLFRKLAEIAGQYLKKGASVYIEGRIRTRKWQDKDGNNRSKLVVICDRLVLLGKRQDSFAEAAAAEFEEEAAF